MTATFRHYLSDDDAISERRVNDDDKFELVIEDWSKSLFPGFNLSLDAAFAPVRRIEKKEN